MEFWDYERIAHARNVWEECKYEDRKLREAEAATKRGGPKPKSKTYQMELSSDFGPQFIPPAGIADE